jgi:5-methylcytosine-specific restriction endonuclease McrA
MTKTTPKKVKSLTPSQWQKKCDALLSPIIIKLFPRCLLCNRPTQVAHHHVHKSKSSILRYDLENLINLCHSCHFALHQNESYYASRIVQIKGLEWFEGLQRKKDKINKVNVGWYETIWQYLSTLL